MNYFGLAVGLASFLIIGLLHPVVIKAEYYLGKRCWPLFAVGGLLSGVASLLIEHQLISVLTGVLAFSLFWSIHEVIEQERRVAKGWFPRNPNRK